MLEISPESLSFRDVQYNEDYLANICITNPHESTVQFELRPSSSNYTVTPNHVNLSGKQSIYVTVHLFILSKTENFRISSYERDDFLKIKGLHFEQKVNIAVFLRLPERRVKFISQPISDRREKPTEGKFSNLKNHGNPSETPDEAKKVFESLYVQLKAKEAKINRLQDIVGQLESRYPSLQQIIRLKVEQEREVFEDKSEKVLRVLRRKDDTIALLQTQLSDRQQEVFPLK